MAYVVSAHWRAKEGKAERLAELIAEMTPPSRAEPGNLFYQAQRAVDDPQLFYLYEQYADEAAYEGMYRVGEGEVTELEGLIDRCQTELAPLRSFVLPGGGRIGAHLHQARTVCRRAERGILRLSRAEPLSPWPLRYVNRLSDLLFVLSRWVAKRLGEQEYLWERGLQGHRAPRP